MEPVIDKLFRAALITDRENRIPNTVLSHLIERFNEEPKIVISCFSSRKVCCI